MRQENGLRVERIPKDVYSQMSAKQRIDIINEALRARIFIILGGVFDQQKVEKKFKRRMQKVEETIVECGDWVSGKE
jgi:hypothetical protein